MIGKFLQKVQLRVTVAKLVTSTRILSELYHKVSLLHRCTTSYYTAQLVTRSTF
jgi:hypothetical protein